MSPGAGLCRPDSAYAAFQGEKCSTAGGIRPLAHGCDRSTGRIAAVTGDASEHPHCAGARSGARATVRPANRIRALPAAGAWDCAASGSRNRHRPRSLTMSATHKTQPSEASVGGPGVEVFFYFSIELTLHLAIKRRLQFLCNRSARKTDSLIQFQRCDLAYSPDAIAEKHLLGIF